MNFILFFLLYYNWNNYLFLLHKSGYNSIDIIEEKDNNDTATDDDRHKVRMKLVDIDQLKKDLKSYEQVFNENR